MELKEYQEATLDAFARWRDALDAARVQSETAIAALQGVGADVPDDVRNYPKTAWQNLAQSGGVAENAGEYVSRTDDAERPIPHVCFKVPTGGGKTLLAAAALERLNRQTGLTLWMVPSKAIYQQTKDALWNREHPYRQMLERASGGRVKLLEKDDPFTRDDVANYLCVMLISLQSANRKRTKNSLECSVIREDTPHSFQTVMTLLATAAFWQRILTWNPHRTMDRSSTVFSMRSRCCVR